MKILYIGLFGGLGCVSRYVLSLWVQQLAGRGFPYGTLLVNLSGSFLLGLLLTLGVRQFPVSPEFRLGLSAGFLGGFIVGASLFMVVPTCDPSEFANRTDEQKLSSLTGGYPGILIGFMATVGTLIFLVSRGLL